MAESNWRNARSIRAILVTRGFAYAAATLSLQTGCSDHAPVAPTRFATGQRPGDPHDQLHVELTRLGLVPESTDLDDAALLAWAFDRLDIAPVSLEFLPLPVSDLSAEELKDVPVPLEITADNRVLPGGHTDRPTVVPLRQVPLFLHGRTVQPGALQQIMASVMTHVIAAGYPGVYVAPGARLSNTPESIKAYAARMELQVIIAPVDSFAFHWKRTTDPDPPFLAINGSNGPTIPPERVDQSVRIIDEWIESNAPFGDGEPLRKRSLKQFLERLTEHVGHPVDVALSRGDAPWTVSLEFFPARMSRSVLHQRIDSYLLAHSGD